MNEELFEELKEFVGSMIEGADLWANDRREVMRYRGMAFGAVQFCLNTSLLPFKEVNDYWQGYAYEKFEEIARDKRNQPKVEVI